MTKRTRKVPVNIGLELLNILRRLEKQGLVNLVNIQEYPKTIQHRLLEQFLGEDCPVVSLDGHIYNPEEITKICQDDPFLQLLIYQADTLLWLFREYNKHYLGIFNLYDPIFNPDDSKELGDRDREVLSQIKNQTYHFRRGHDDTRAR